MSHRIAEAIEKPIIDISVCDVLDTWGGGERGRGVMIAFGILNYSNIKSIFM